MNFANPHMLWLLLVIPPALLAVLLVGLAQAAATC